MTPQDREPPSVWELDRDMAILTERVDTFIKSHNARHQEGERAFKVKTDQRFVKIGIVCASIVPFMVHFLPK